MGVPFEGRIALANSGPLQIELIDQRSPVRTSYSDFLDAGHEGLHHVGFFSEDYDELLHRGLDTGLAIEQDGVLFSPEGKFTYFATTGHPGTIQELIAVHDGNRDLFQMIAASYSHQSTALWSTLPQGICHAAVTPTDVWFRYSSFPPVTSRHQSVIVAHL
jgi:hypothetical protein